jgi:hypothetical protein
VRLKRSTRPQAIKYDDGADVYGDDDDEDDDDDDDDGDAMVAAAANVELIFKKISI